MINAPFFPSPIAPVGETSSADALDQAIRPAEAAGGDASFFSILGLLGAALEEEKPRQALDSLKPGAAAPVEEETALESVPAPLQRTDLLLATDTAHNTVFLPLEMSEALRGETQRRADNSAVGVFPPSFAPVENAAKSLFAPLADQGYAGAPAVAEIVGAVSGGPENPDGADLDAIHGAGRAGSVPRTDEAAAAARIAEEKIFTMLSQARQPSNSPAPPGQEGRAFAAPESYREITRESPLEAPKSAGSMDPGEFSQTVRPTAVIQDGNFRSYAGDPLRAGPESGSPKMSFAPQTGGEDNSKNAARPSGPGQERVLPLNIETDSQANDANSSVLAGTGKSGDGIHTNGDKSGGDKSGAQQAQPAASIRSEAPFSSQPPSPAPQGAAPVWRPVVARVSGEIASHLSQNRHEAVIQLDPPELGKLRINLLVQGDTVHARLFSETDEARAMLQTHLPELREALQVHKLDLSHVSVEVSGWSAHGEEREGRWPPGAQRGERDDASTAENKKQAEDGAARGERGVNLWA